MQRSWLSAATLCLGDQVPNVNLMPLALVGSELQLLSWNGRGIVVWRSKEHHEQGAAIRRLSNNRHILCFQEVHGKSFAVKAFFNRILPGWHISLSVCKDCQDFEDPSSGGVVIAICPRLSRECNIELLEIVPGRCLSVSLWARISGIKRNLHILTLHNFGLSNEQVSAVGNILNTIGDTCRRFPTQDFACLIGDFNFSAREDRIFKVGRPLLESTPATIGGSGTKQLQWERLLASWTEVVQPFPTHYNKYGNTCNKLDRAFVSCPSSLLLKLAVSHTVVGTPEQTFSVGESDHAPISLCFGRQVKTTIGDSPIPKWVAKHPNYKVHLKSLTEYIGIRALDVSEQLLTYKDCMKEAARRVRNETLYLNPDGSAERKIVLSSISRALWFNNLPLARKLLRWSAFAKDLIHIVDCKVLAFSYESCEQIF